MAISIPVFNSVMLILYSVMIPLTVAIDGGFQRSLIVVELIALTLEISGAEYGSKIRQ